MNNPHSSVQAVLFDYGMVLSGPPTASAWARLRSITGLDEITLQREYWAYRHAYDRGTHSGEAYWQLIAAGGGRPPLDDHDLSGVLDADTDLWTDLNPPMVEWAHALRRAGIRVGILSNIGDHMELGVLRKHPWLGSFDHHTWSHRLKLAKPEAAIYLHAAEGLGVPPGNILFVDDKLENIVAALASGMQALQYTGHGAFLDEMGKRGFGPLLTPSSLSEEVSTSTAGLP